MVAISTRDKRQNAFSLETWPNFLKRFTMDRFATYFFKILNEK